MKLSDVMGAAGLTSWAEVGLIISFITFAAIVAYVFIVRSKASYEDERNLPLEDNDECQVRNSAVTPSHGPTDPLPESESNRGTTDLAPPEVST